MAELTLSLPSITLPFSGHVSESLDPSNHINPKLNKALPWSLQPFEPRSNIKAPISFISNTSAMKPKATTLPTLEKWDATKKTP
jgi:hypothetical protein